MDPVGPWILEGPHRELERRAGNVHLAVAHGDSVDAQLSGHKVHRVQPIL